MILNSFFFVFKKREKWSHSYLLLVSNNWRPKKHIFLMQIVTLALNFFINGFISFISIPENLNLSNARSSFANTPFKVIFIKQNNYPVQTPSPSSLCICSAVKSTDLDWVVPPFLQYIQYSRIQLKPFSNVVF